MLWQSLKIVTKFIDGSRGYFFFFQMYLRPFVVPCFIFCYIALQTYNEEICVVS